MAVFSVSLFPSQRFNCRNRFGKWDTVSDLFGRPAVRLGAGSRYLTKDEIEALNLIVSAYLDFAELQARSHKPMHMADWIGKLDDFIRLSERDILTHAGNISHREAEVMSRPICGSQAANGR